MSAQTRTYASQSRTNDIYTLFQQVADSSFIGDRQRTELLVLKAIRIFRQDNPGFTEKLSDILSHYSSSVGVGALRGSAVAPLPADQDGGMALIKVDYAEDAAQPVLPEAVQRHVDRFILERCESQVLLNEGFSPPRTVLLKGPPGTGKTMLSAWMAKRLGLPIVTLDLATSISSFLGKTGFNLRRSLDYARANPCLLLLDEFDSIAKRRDDATEVGELKRIVNVLLKELEEWPIHSVLVAATNHPELLDPAIERRFDVVWDLPLPGDRETKDILEQSLGRFSSDLSDKLWAALTKSLQGFSGSELTTVGQAAVRNHLVCKESVVKSLIEELHSRGNKRSPRDQLALLLHELEPLYTQRELASLFGVSPSTINYHLNKERTHG